MYHPLDGCNAKLDRAHKHLDALNAEQARFGKSKPCTFLRKPEPNSPKQTFWLRVDRPPDPDGRIATLIGDFAHNVRSALDHLAWELVGHHGLPQTNRTEFPIFKNDALYWGVSATAALGGCPPPRSQSSTECSHATEGITRSGFSMR